MGLGADRADHAHGHGDAATRRGQTWSVLSWWRRRRVGRAWLNDAAGALGGSIDLFLSDSKTRDLSLFYLFLAIQACIDLAAHWVADEGWGEPDDAGSAYDVLADRRVIDRDTATALRAAAGLRNRIAHGYALLDHARVHREAQTGIPASRAFLVAITRAAGLESDSVRAPVGP